MDYGLRMMMGGGMYFWLIPLILLVLIIFSGYKLFGGDKGKETKIKHGDPLLIVKERYANGEIDEEEYMKMKKVLEK